MINIFLLDYYTRLREWFKLKENLKGQDISTICIEVDRFWQKTPLLNHYLYARGLGMVYTLMLLGVKDIDFVDIIDDNRENVVLVLVDNAKYVLNYHPNSVLNINLSSFTVVKYINISSLKKKIGEE